MSHTPIKVPVVHELWLSVGSATCDCRSFSLDDETNPKITDQHPAARQITIFEHDVANSKAVTYGEWQRRSLAEKLIEHGAFLLRMQL